MLRGLRALFHQKRDSPPPAKISGYRSPEPPNPDRPNGATAGCVASASRGRKRSFTPSTSTRWGNSSKFQGSCDEAANQIELPAKLPDGGTSRAIRILNADGTLTVDNAKADPQEKDAIKYAAMTHDP